MPENQTDTNLQKELICSDNRGKWSCWKISYISSFLLKGYKVSHLSRNANQFGKVRVFRWDPEKKIIDPLIFEGIDYIIHLAGANIGEKRWTKKRKEEIIKKPC